MIGYGKFPGIRQTNRNDFSRAQTRCDQAARQPLYGFAVFGIGEAAARGGVDQGGLIWETAAGRQNGVVQKDVAVVGVELCASHAEKIVYGRGIRQPNAELW